MSQARRRSSPRRSRPSSAPASSTSGSSSPQQTLDDARRGAARQAGRLRLGASDARRTCAPTIDAANAAVKLAERQLRDASIRAPFEGYVQKRLVSLGELVKVADAGDDHRPRRSAESHRGDSGADGALGPGAASRSTCRSMRFPTGIFTGKVVADQPGRQPADARVPVRGARAQRRRPAQAGHVRSRPARRPITSSRCSRSRTRRCSTATA